MVTVRLLASLVHRAAMVRAIAVFPATAWAIKIKRGAGDKLFDAGRSKAFGHELIFGTGHKDIEQGRGSDEAGERPLPHSRLLEGNDGYGVIEPIHRCQFIGAKKVVPQSESNLRRMRYSAVSR